MFYAGGGENPLFVRGLLACFVPSYCNLCHCNQVKIRMYVDDVVYGSGLSKRLFSVAGSSRTSVIVRQWLCTDEGKSFFENVNNAGQYIEVKRSRIRDLLVDY